MILPRRGFSGHRLITCVEPSSAARFFAEHAPEKVGEHPVLLRRKGPAESRRHVGVHAIIASYPFRKHTKPVLKVNGVNVPENAPQHLAPRDAVLFLGVSHL